VNVNVVALEANDIHFATVGGDERREDFAANPLDVFL
jgi:hypothetical protein